MEALCSEQCTSIDDEVTAIIAEASIAFGRLRGNVWDQSGIWLDTKLKVYKACGTTNPLICTRPGQCNNAKPEDLTWLFQLKLPEKNPKNHLARQGPGYRGPEECGDTKRIYSFEAALHSLYGLAMSQECLMSGYRNQKKSFMENFWLESAPRRTRPNAIKDTLKASHKDFNIPLVLGTDCTGSS